MEYILIFFIVLVYSFQGVFLKFYNNNYTPNNEDSSKVFTVLLGLVVAFTTLPVRWISQGFGFGFTWLVLFLGVLNSVAIFFYNKFLVMASERGPYSIVTIFMVSGGILIPLVASLFMGAELHWLRLIGIAVMFLAFFLLCKEKGETTQRRPGFYLYCIALGVSNGIFGTILTLEEKLEGNSNKSELVVFTYIFSALISLAFLAIRRKGGLKNSFRITPKALIFALMSMLCITLGVNLLVFCLSYINPGVLYTLQNGGVMVTVAILSLVLFKEKLNLQKWVGIIIAAISTVLLVIDPILIGI